MSWSSPRLPWLPTLALLAACSAPAPQPELVTPPSAVTPPTAPLPATAPPPPVEPPPSPTVAAKSSEDPCAASPETGTLKGHLVFADGTVPASFTGSSSRQRPGWHSSDDCDGRYQEFPSKGSSAGDFVFEGLPPGLYDLTLLGDTFINHDTGFSRVEAGKVNDLGTLTLDRGRTLRGRVLGANQAPLAGVEVHAGENLWASTKSFLGYIGRSATTAADGSFTLIALEREAVFVAADSPTLGRSVTLRLPPGAGELRQDLRLVATGVLAGRVTFAGDVAQADVKAEPLGLGHGVTFSATTKDDGSYRFERLAEGTYVITAQLVRGNLHSLVHPAKVGQASISAAKAGQLDLDIPTGTLVTIQTTVTKGTADLVSAVLVKGTLAARTDADLDLALEGLDLERARQEHVYLAEGTSMEISDVPPGSYTLCGSSSKSGDSRVALKARPTSCKPVTVTAGVKRLEVTLAVVGR